ncbi:MAG: Imidazole glycerol phosphate synthase subunit HisH [SAR116 cluster bacterium MED-G04]|nr:MAG: Imidazole glycerol phosphate synthase subunit HisH [SAR116 cluster bacterium MED-G04]
MTDTTTIIDTRSANIVSVWNALSSIGIDAVITNDHAEIANSARIILPGVGAFDTCVQALEDADLAGLISDCVLGRGIPLLGICVGMQVLFEGSEEGSGNGLGFLPGHCKRLRPDPVAMKKVPHNGFAEVRIADTNPLKAGLRDKEYFYFNHSYGIFDATDGMKPDWVSHTDEVIASFQYNTIFGMQYHPEKSQLAGLKVLSNFVAFSRGESQ